MIQEGERNHKRMDSFDLIKAPNMDGDHKLRGKNNFNKFEWCIYLIDKQERAKQEKKGNSIKKTIK